MEMWHNGEQASTPTIAVGATTMRATNSNKRGFHHIGLPPKPPTSSVLSLSLTHSHLFHVTFEQEF